MYQILSRLLKKSYVGLILSTIFTLGFIACSSDEEHSNSTKNGKIQLSFNVDGVTEGSDSMLTKTQSEPQVMVKSLDDGFELVCSLSPDPKSLKRAVSALPNGIAYRVIAYKKNGATYDYDSYFDGTTSATSANNQLLLDADATYKIVAYSYRTASIPDPAPSAATTTVTPSGGSDLLYWSSGDIATVYGSNSPQSITFSQKLAKVQAQIVSANGYVISSVTASLSAMNDVGSMVLLDGTVSEGSSHNLTNFTLQGSSSAISRGIPSSTLSATTYTNFIAGDSRCVFAKNYGALTLNISSISTGDAGGFGTLTGKSTTFSGVNLVAGNKYILDVRIRKNYTNTWFDGTITGNLYKTGAGIGVAATQATVGTSMSSGYYWNWDILSGTNPASDYDDFGFDTYWGSPSRPDPCASRFPGYRLPNGNEIKTLVSNGCLIANGGLYCGTVILPATGTENSYVFLPTYGSRSSGSSFVLAFSPRYHTSEGTPSTPGSYQSLQVSGGTVAFITKTDGDIGGYIRCIK
jgi:hypothetical protein